MKINFSKKIGVSILVIFVILLFGLLLFQNQRVEILTDKKEYENGTTLKIKIRNLSLKNICFSSCYPYYLEKKEGSWKPYNYQECIEPDLAEKCMKPGETKAFEISLPKVKKGIHRVAIPCCENCKMNSEFKETKRFYSNEFEIK